MARSQRALPFFLTAPPLYMPELWGHPLARWLPFRLRVCPHGDAQLRPQVVTACGPGFGSQRLGRTEDFTDDPRASQTPGTSKLGSNRL